jgi:hypothetical protein
VADIGSAKKVLIQKFKPNLGACMFTAERRNSSTRTAHEAEIDDILGIFDFLDTTNAIGNHVFAAINLHHLPKFGPEEMNFAAIVDRQVHIETSIQNVSAAVEQLAMSRDSDRRNDADVDSSDLQSKFVSTQQQFESFRSDVCGRFDQLAMVCATYLKSSDSTRIPPSSSVSVDRSLNLIVFGVKEDRNADVWRRRVDDVLNYVKANQLMLWICFG